MPQFLTIDDPIQLVIIMLAVIAFFVIIFRVENWFDSLPAKSSKPKAQKSAPAETKKEAEPPKEKPIEQTKSTDYKPSQEPPTYICPYASSTQTNNYLYDRFVSSPTKDDDYESKKIHSAFISEKDLKAIRDRQPRVLVKNRSELYSKIEQMSNQNQATRERMLKEFEDLPKEIKLMLIDNIMSKM